MQLFYFDNLAVIMMILVAALGLIIWIFSYRYMQGDRFYRRFLAQLGLLIITLLLMFSANNIWLFLSFWTINYGLLVSLMIHKADWSAAKASGFLAGKYFLASILLLLIAFIILIKATGFYTFQNIIYENSIPQNSAVMLALSLILLAAMIQSGIWPFQRWLLSSLNCPTPISAVMHAGLINGGGFLLVRFAPLYLKNPHFLMLMFIVGAVSALLATAFKLIQSNNKNMLACSTMAQMGFVFLECGLGLFSVAVSHICCHGFFKAYLFLNSGSAAQQEILTTIKKNNVYQIFLASFCGLITVSIIILVSNSFPISFNAQYVLYLFYFITVTQLAMILLRDDPHKYLFSTLFLTIFSGVVYGAILRLFNHLLPTEMLEEAQSLNFIYFIGALLFFIAWFLFSIKEKLTLPKSIRQLKLFIYVTLLNSSQPSPKTLTVRHNDYKF